MKLLQDQQVLILGLGISGLSMARWCTRQGAHVTVADTRENPPSLSALQSDCPQAQFVSGAFDDALLARAAWSLIARSPGLPPAQLNVAQAWAMEHGAAWLGELDLFAQALQALAQREVLPYQPQVLAITGTNGKTTVTSLTGLLLQRAGWRVAVAGNIGPALLDVLAAALDAEANAQAQAVVEAENQVSDQLADEPDGVRDVGAPGASMGCDEQCAQHEEGAPFDHSPGHTEQSAEAVEAVEAAEAVEAVEAAEAVVSPSPAAAVQPPHLPQVWVLELSSFQLDGTAGGAWRHVPTAATLLNITEDHLDWHGSMDAYAQAKAAVYGERALMVLNRDDPRVMAHQPSQVIVKVGGRNRSQPARAYTSFGLDTPVGAGDWGLESVNGMTWLVKALPMDETRKRSRSTEDDPATYLQRLMPAEALRIYGRHNAANALAALALATSTGAPLGPMLHGLREYRGEPHRVSSVAIVQGVEYFDDSKGTNVGATLAAIRGLGADRRLVVIMGGDGKGQDFAPLAEPLVQHARAVVLIGRDAQRMEQQLADALHAAGVLLASASDLPAAVSLACGLAHEGDAVLLSPACASLDMFRDYKHRAEVFVLAVRELALSQGMDLEGAL